MTTDDILPGAALDELKALQQRHEARGARLAELEELLAQAQAGKEEAIRAAEDAFARVSEMERTPCADCLTMQRIAFDARMAMEAAQDEAADLRRELARRQVAPEPRPLSFMDWLFG